MLKAIADTHAIVWYLYGDARLSPTAKAFIEDTAAHSDQVGLSAITLAEIVYLAEKGRIASETFSRLTAAIEQPDSVLVDIAFDRAVAETLARIDRASVPELPDRIIAATALCLDVPLISRDGRIKASGVPIIW
jgi:PIN domain nuclease of toxin-antitoxin system